MTLFVALISLLGAPLAQDNAQRTLPLMPRYDRYEKMIREAMTSIDRGVTSVVWAEDSKSFSFRRAGKWRTYSVDRHEESEGTAPKDGAARSKRGRPAPERARQFDIAFSNDGKWQAKYRDKNVYLTSLKDKKETAITTSDSPTTRVRYGVASWVYGEELYVRDAMWFSPDSEKLAFYKTDETQTPDYYLGLKQLAVYDELDQEAYPKAGAPNPKVGLLIYDVKTKEARTIDTTFGSAENAEYIYNVNWSPDGKELFYFRMNRAQNHWEWCAYDPISAKSRVVLTQTRSSGWIDQLPSVTFLKDQRRFIFRSDETGFHNLYLYDLTGKRLTQLTNHGYEVETIVNVDETHGVVYYLARSAPNPYLFQLHRVKLDGSGDEALTDPSLHHDVFLSPDCSHFVDVAESIDSAPVTTLRDINGKSLAEISKADTAKLDQQWVKKPMRFTFPSADGKFTCYGKMVFPSDFDPAKKYPVLVFVYGGPESGGSPERFSPPQALCEFGFIIVSMDGRNTSGRGREFLTAGYKKLGQYEIDDHAAGVKYLAKTYPFIDGKRVGIQGTSYGGYFSAMSILRYPDVYAAACSSSPVTDWRLYDSIYTERYMGLPTEDDNLKGYQAGSCMTYADDLKGRLMLYFGTADNNVHPSNAIQLADALEKKGKRFDMMLGADKMHTQMNSSRMWEYFINYLILDVPKDGLAARYDQLKLGNRAKKSS